MAEPIFTLVTAKDVLDAMGQDPELLAASKTAIESALKRAKLRLEGFLKTELGHQTVTDTFLVNDREGIHPDGTYRLRLSCGCIRSDVAVSATTGPSMADVAAGALDLTGLNLDLDKGYLYLPADGTYDNTYVSVSYSAGFTADDDPDSIPEELKQSMLCFTPLLLLSASAATAEPKQQAATMSKANSMDAFAQDMLPRFMRNVGAALRPVRTVRERSQA